MKAILISEHGGTEVLKYTEVDTPVPEGGEILVKVAGTTAAYADTRQRAGNYPMIPPLPLFSLRLALYSRAERDLATLSKGMPRP